jgi:hypothetical protein
MTDIAPIGHNGGPDLYINEIGKIQAIDAVLKNPRLSQTEALVLIGLIVRSNPAYANAFPGAATLAVYAKVKRTDTVFNALKQLEDHFGMIRRASRGLGRSNSYTVIPQRVVDAIVSEYDARKAAKAKMAAETHPPKPGGYDEKPTLSNRVSSQEPTRPNRVPPPASHPVEAGPTHPPKPGTYPINDPIPKQGGQNQFVPLNWKTTLNTHAAADASDVFWVDGCKIEVVNGFKVELQNDFPNVDLIAGLSAVAGEITPRTVGTELKRSVRRKFGYMQNDEKNRDRRHAQTVKANKTQASSKQPDFDSITKIVGPRR